MIPGWRADAACLRHRAELFDPVTSRETLRDRVVRVRVARSVCAGCPVKADCYTAGRKGKESGVWGGVLLAYGRRVPEPPIAGLTVAVVELAPDTRALSLVQAAQ